MINARIAFAGHRLAIHREYNSMQRFENGRGREELPLKSIKIRLIFIFL